MIAQGIVRAARVMLALAALRSASAQRSIVRPGDARLRPARVRVGTDTIVVLVDPVHGPETRVATLVRRRANTAAPAAFHDMMLEAFTAAFPFAAGASLSLPTLRPPDTSVRAVDVDVSPSPVTLRTAGGPVECLVVTRRGRDVTTWIAKGNGHIVRMRWTNTDGSVTWKLPARDVPFRN